MPDIRAIMSNFRDTEDKQSYVDGISHPSTKTDVQDTGSGSSLPCGASLA
jgi:hypothetical protein